VVTVDANHNLRGLYFLPTDPGDKGFTFGGGSTLTLGRGGITNYAGSRQVFNADLALGAPQYWDGGTGGITAATVNTTGHLLEITGSGENRITGEISGAGSLAVSGGILELTGANTYTGSTWVHAGELRVNNTTGAGAGTGSLVVAPEGMLSGGGILANVTTTVAGAISPGNSIGTLTVANSVTWNAGAPWVFELGEAAASLANAGLGLSAQDLLMVGGDFLKGSGSAWTFDFAGTGDNGWYRLVDWEGSTTFNAADFVWTNLALGKDGSFVVDGTTSALYLSVIPEPRSAALALLAVAMLWGRRSRRPL
jgi:MYXO-CTERM domain-containing protein